MKARQETALFEDLHRWGTPLDEGVLRNARLASQGLKITQFGAAPENIAYVKASGMMGIMLNMCIENVSDRIVKVDAIRLQLPWSDADFHWLQKQSPKVLNQWGGYVLSACGPYGINPAIVLNHRLTPNFKFYPGDVLEGCLLGESSAPVPTEYLDRMVIPVRLLIFAGSRGSYEGWLHIGICRQVQKTKGNLISRQRAPRLTHSEVGRRQVR